MAGTSGSEAGVAALLAAVCKSRELRLLDIRGIPVAGQVCALCWQAGNTPLRFSCMPCGKLWESSCVCHRSSLSRQVYPT